MEEITLSDFVILDKTENGSILVNTNNIVAYICGAKADRVFILNNYEMYKKHESFTLKKNLYIVDTLLKDSPFIKLNLKDVDLPCYINKNYISYIDSIVKTKGDNFTAIDNLIYTIDNELYNVTNQLKEIKELLDE